MAALPRKGLFSQSRLAKAQEEAQHYPAFLHFAYGLIAFRVTGLLG
jgi:hypothetical protein